MVFRWTLIAGGLAVLLACSSPEEIAAGVQEAQGETAAERLDRRTAAGFDPVEFTDEESSGEAARDFAYSWPAQVSAIAPLAAMLEASRDAELAKQKSEWEESVAEFATAEDGYQCITCVNRSYAKSWQVAADTPRFLVIGAENYFYTGGAHGNTIYDGLVWDRDGVDGKGAALDPIALFSDPSALEAVSRGAYCPALLKLRGERLDMNTDTMDPLAECPPIADLVMLPKSSDGERFDLITFLAAPYVAGSYAEGSYEFTIPVTDAILAQVRPEYRSAFAAK